MGFSDLPLLAQILIGVVVCVIVSYVVYGAIRKKWNPFSKDYWKKGKKNNSPCKAGQVTFNDKGELVPCTVKEGFIEYDSQINDFEKLIAATDAQLASDDFVKGMMTCREHATKAGFACDYTKPIRFWFSEKELRTMLGATTLQDFQYLDDLGMHPTPPDLKSSDWMLVDTYEKLLAVWNIAKSITPSEFVKTQLQENAYKRAGIKYPIYLDGPVVTFDIIGDDYLKGLRPGMDVPWAVFMHCLVLYSTAWGIWPELVLPTGMTGALKDPTAIETYRSMATASKAWRAKNSAPPSGAGTYIVSAPP